VALSDRFQEAIDAAAMACGLVGSDDYTNAFAWGDPVEHPGTPAEAAAAVAARIESETQSIDWRATAKKVKRQDRESE
jgi:methionyl-tRNA formyltransferase